MRGTVNLRRRRGESSADSARVHCAEELCLSICLQNVNGEVRSRPICVDSAGETITADQDETQEDVHAREKSWRDVCDAGSVIEPVVRSPLFVSLMYLFRSSNRHGFVRFAGRVDTMFVSPQQSVQRVIGLIIFY